MHVVKVQWKRYSSLALSLYGHHDTHFVKDLPRLPKTRYSFLQQRDLFLRGRSEHISENFVRALPTILPEV